MSKKKKKKKDPYSEVEQVDNLSRRVAFHLWFSLNYNLRQVQQPLAVGYLKGPLELHSQGPHVSQGLSPHVHLVRRNISSAKQTEKPQWTSNAWCEITVKAVTVQLCNP